MKKLRQLLRLRPLLGDNVAGSLDFGITYKGKVVETNYGENEILRGAYISGKVYISNMWMGEIIIDTDKEFVPLNRLKISK